MKWRGHWVPSPRYFSIGISGVRVAFPVYGQLWGPTPYSGHRFTRGGGGRAGRRPVSPPVRVTMPREGRGGSGVRVRSVGEGRVEAVRVRGPREVVHIPYTHITRIHSLCRNLHSQRARVSRVPLKEEGPSPRDEWATRRRWHGYAYGFQHGEGRQRAGRATQFQSGWTEPCGCG